MRLTDEDDAIAKQALNKVLERAQAAVQAGDIETAIAGLVATRDTIVGSVITLRAIADNTRARALKALETA